MALGEWNIAFQPYGEAWRSRRRIFHSGMQLSAVPKYEGAQLRQTRIFLKQLAADSDDLGTIVRGYVAHTRLAYIICVAHEYTRTVGAVIMDVVYGIQVTGTRDKYITVAEDVVERISSAAMPGKFLVDSIPSCTLHKSFRYEYRLTSMLTVRYIPRWLPGSDFHKMAASFRAVIGKLVEDPMQELEKAMVCCLYDALCAKFDTLLSGCRNSQDMLRLRAARREQRRQRGTNHNQRSGSTDVSRFGVHITSLNDVHVLLRSQYSWGRHCRLN